MDKERAIPNLEIATMATRLADIFIQRRDLYARQFDDGSYVCIRKPLEQRHLIAHLKGEITLGSYVLDANSQARFIVLDADDENQWDKLLTVANSLSRKGIPSYLETSRRGGHLWLFFAKALPGQMARKFGRGLLARLGHTEMELFPKQDRLSQGPGSLIRMPFGIHRKTGQRYGFITPQGQPIAASLVDQINILSAPQRVPETAIKPFLVDISKPVQKPVLAPIESPNGSLSKRIKESIGVFEFISSYVALSPNGRGLCPFHPDQHASLAVNIEGNYWHCFAGCGGGSIIDFWMKWRECDFTTAVRELAQLLLSSS